MDWLKQRIEGNDRLQNSAAVRRVMESVANYRLPESIGIRDGASSIGFDPARRVEGWLPSASAWKSDILPLLKNLPRPNLPDVRLPEIQIPNVSVPTVGVPSIPAPSGVQLEAVLIIVLGGFVAILVLKLFRKHGLSKALPIFGAVYETPAAPRWDPRQPLRDRADLIAAFESVSLVQIGPAAAHHHHRDLTELLGGANVERRRIAQHVGQLYEHARYRPAGDEITPESLQAARRQLQFLSGNENA
jgi:hypothetical protein